MQPEDILLLGVAGVVAFNRGFAATRLRDSDAAYVVVQLVNVATCIGLFFFRLDGYPANLDFWIRTFLTLFVGWQMVNNNHLRVERRRRKLDDELRVRDRQRRLDEIHAGSEDDPG